MSVTFDDRINLLAPRTNFRLPDPNCRSIIRSPKYPAIESNARAKVPESEPSPVTEVCRHRILMDGAGARSWQRRRENGQGCQPTAKEPEGIHSGSIHRLSLKEGWNHPPRILRFSLPSATCRPLGGLLSFSLITAIK